MSISRKFTIWIISVVLVLGFLSAYLYYRLEMHEETERLESFGNTIGPIIEESLANYMLTKDDTVLDRTLHNLKGIEPISRIWLINEEGVIKAGTDKKEAGTKLSPTDMRCQRCHEEGKRGTFLKGEKTFRWVHPVRNKPECHKCHSPQIMHNGVILIDFSLEVSEKHIKKDIFRDFLVFIPTIIFIGFVMFMLSKTVVINRLNSVVNRIKEFREGNYNARIPVKGNDEITRLEDGFNKMAEGINIRDKDLRDSYQKYEDLVNSLDSIVWEADAKTSQFSFVSRQAERLLGYPIERWLTEPTFWKDHIHPDDREWAVAFCVNAISEKRPHDFEYRMIADDGRTVWLRDIVNVVIENDQSVKLRGVMVDITGWKQAEEMRRKSEEHFREVIENIFKFIPEGLLVFTDKLNLFKQNKAFRDIVKKYAAQLNYTEEELEGIILDEVKNRIVRGDQTEIRIPHKE